MFRFYHLGLQTLLLSAITYAPSAFSASVPQTCNPNFQGQAQVIYALPPTTDSGVYEWTPDSISPGAHITLQKQELNDPVPQNQFLVPLTGQPDGSYNFRLQADTDRDTVITAGTDGDLTIELLSLLESIPSQRFTIDCEACPSTDPNGATAAKQCVIKNPASGLCVVGSNPGDTLHLGPCSAPGTYQFQVAA